MRCRYLAADANIIAADQDPIRNSGVVGSRISQGVATFSVLRTLPGGTEAGGRSPRMTAPHRAVAEVDELGAGVCRRIRFGPEAEEPQEECVDRRSKGRGSEEDSGDPGAERHPSEGGDNDSNVRKEHHARHCSRRRGRSTREERCVRRIAHPSRKRARNPSTSTSSSSCSSDQIARTAVRTGVPGSLRARKNRRKRARSASTSTPNSSSSSSISDSETESRTRRRTRRLKGGGSRTREATG